MTATPREFELFYRTTKDSCLRAVVATVPDSTIAEDLVSEAFARALERWGQLRDHPAPSAWVVRTAVNLHRDAWRSSVRPRRSFRSVPVAEPPDLLIDPVLVGVLQGLPVRQREVLALRLLLGLSNEQTAAELGISAGTVPVHLRRALEVLRRTYPTREAFHERT